MNSYRILGPVFRSLPPETAHRAAVLALKYRVVPAAKKFSESSLAQTLWGLHFENPVGLAAGFDKNAEAARGLLTQGFGFVECGTVTPRPQEGNPRPRMFRLREDDGVINRLGFNNLGVDAFLRHVPSREKRRGILGLNIGKNKETENALNDYLLLLRAVYAESDYITVNISSPNTAGLRDLQAKEMLGHLLRGLLAERVTLSQQQGRQVPMLLKVAPDLTQEECEDIAALALELKLDGLIVGNTTISRPAHLLSCYATETGGLSGKPLMALSTDTLRRFYRLTGARLPLVGVGGIASAEDAYIKVRAGASLVQLYSALVYQGMGLVGEINHGLVELLRRDGFENIVDAVGTENSSERTAFRS